MIFPSIFNKKKRRKVLFYTIGSESKGDMYNCQREGLLEIVKILKQGYEIILKQN